MTDNGVVLVVAAGNSPSATDHSAYANIPGVINVSGVDASNNHAPTGHARNQWVDACALSKNVAACVPGNTYRADATTSGTSFAAPQVAGVAALIRSINNSLSPAQVENIIKSTTDPIADAHLFPGLLGTGRVNAYKAVQAACATSSINFTTPTVNTTQTVPGGNINVQNVTVTNGATLTIKAACDINVQGVTVKNNSKLILDADGEVNIISDFDVELGSEFEIKYP